LQWKTLTSSLTHFVKPRRELSAAEVEEQLATPPPKKKPEGNVTGKKIFLFCAK
jgi:hypothetical protein